MADFNPNSLDSLERIDLNTAKDFMNMIKQAVPVTATPTTTKPATPTMIPASPAANVAPPTTEPQQPPSPGLTATIATTTTTMDLVPLMEAVQPQQQSQLSPEHHHQLHDQLATSLMELEFRRAQEQQQQATEQQQQQERGQSVDTLLGFDEEPIMPNLESDTEAMDTAPDTEVRQVPTQQQPRTAPSGKHPRNTEIRQHINEANAEQAAKELKAAKTAKAEARKLVKARTEAPSAFQAATATAHKTNDPTHNLFLQIGFGDPDKEIPADITPEQERALAHCRVLHESTQEVGNLRDEIRDEFINQRPINRNYTHLQEHMQEAGGVLVNVDGRSTVNVSELFVRLDNATGIYALPTLNPKGAKGEAGCDMTTPVSLIGIT